MPLFSGEALILRTYKLGEADRIVVFLSRDRGKKRGVAKGARRTRSRFLGALEPLTLASVAYFEREHRELVNLNYAESQRSPFSTTNPDALGYVGYFAELIDEWCPDSDPNEKLYRLGAAAVDALARSVPIEPLARYFEYWLLRLQGVYPSFSACRQCGDALTSGGRLLGHGHGFACVRCRPDSTNGTRVAGLPTGGSVLSADAFAFLRTAASIGPDQLGQVPLSAGAARELEATHRLLIAGHLEKELRSSRILRELQQ